ncbi:hypothetical protein [Streptomyces tropicalis]|uniref:Alkaline shock response membrane anchor protein AmaP n=1 Tax=Streptomyces tropicalis TaxID=3034234 RepID=A0ABT6A4C5_9ACTN|nr:hypothetical protein [Streptomyces tropicalis]MDF3299241.1 hypothetical protein [Streptomyces tropicalis]
MAEPRTAANRAVLAASGLVLLVGGAWAATAGTPLARHLLARWPAPAPGGTLLDRAGLAGLRDHGWWTPAVIAAGVLLTVLFALWCLAQVHVRAGSRLPLAAPGGALRIRALEDAVTARTADLPGVDRCRADLSVRRRHLRLRLHVWAAPDVAPGTVAEALTAVTAEVERVAAPCTLDTRVRLRHRTHRMPHVR